MITRVEYDNIRGLSSAVDLGARNLIVGPNGSGKTTVMVAIDFALLGLVPGYQKGDMVANASGATLRAKVTIDGHTIERTLRQGKTLQERIAIDGGTPADAKAAAPLLEAILGREPRLLNMPAFWAATDAEKRRMILKLRATPEVQAKLGQDEQQARDAKNAATKRRQDAEAVVKRLTLSLAGIEKPTGNLGALEAESAGIEADLAALLDRIRAGEANDRARATMTATVADMPNLKVACEKAAAAVRDAEAAKTQWEARVAEIAAVEPRQEDRVDMPDALVESVQGVINDLTDLHAELPGWADKLAVQIGGVVATMESWLPDSEAVAGSRRAVADWIKTRDLAAAALRKAENAVRVAKNDDQHATALVVIAENAEKRLAPVGPGVDPHDVAARAGLEQRKSEIEAKLAPLRRIDAIEREIKSAEIAAERETAVEEDRKTTLAAAIERQQAVVEGAVEDLALRSREILPEGQLGLNDDGRNISIYWQRGNVHVQRCALSGGEQALFDCAVGHSLAPGALVAVEAAEADDDRVGAMLAHFPTAIAQVAVLTCHPPVVGQDVKVRVYEVPPSWNVITMGDK